MTKTSRFKQAYFNQDPISLSRSLLGKKLVTRFRGHLTAGKIVEVETYLGSNDPACHAARGLTARNAVMFKQAGHCYVYLIYGMYHCVNVVSDKVGVGSAVLIRAIEPLEGIEIMERRRGAKIKSAFDLARGPGRLCQALGIMPRFSGQHLASSERIWIEPHDNVAAGSIAVSGRIGISQGADLPLRFYIKDNPWVSRRT